MARPTRTQGTVRRTRAGCITCKIRHVKCDEAKPICQRCATKGYKCDGYDQFKQLTSDDYAKKPVATQKRPVLPRTSQETTIQLSRTLQKRYLLPHPATPTLQLSSSNVENIHLYHVRTCVIRDMAAVARSTKFWHTYVLPLSHSLPAIRQALCALGAAHRCFISDRHESSGLLLSQSDLVTEAMQRYNDAIAALNALVSSSDTTGAHLDVVLICCVVFITIENLHGRSAAAACHLRAGCDIVKRFRSAAPAGAAAHGTAGRGDDTARFLLVLQDMLCGFGQCLSSYVGLDLFADLDFGMPVSDPGRPGVPFASVAEAEAMLASIDRAFYTRMWKAEAYSPQPSSVADVFADRTRSLESQGPRMDLAYRRTARMAATQDFLIWRERCEPLLARKGDGDARRVASLALDRGIWGIILVDGSSHEPFASDKCHEVLSLAEDVIRADASAADRRPLFTCEGMLIWALYYICYGSEDVAVRKRGIALLRAANKREGLWDSRDVAAICEAAEAALESGAITYRDIPHGILTLADMLHVRPRGFSLDSVRGLAGRG